MLCCALVSISIIIIYSVVVVEQDYNAPKSTINVETLIVLNCTGVPLLVFLPVHGYLSTDWSSTVLI